MRILGFGTYDTSRHPRVGILLEGLRAAGDDVAEANTPLGFPTAARVALLERPWTALPFVAGLLRCWWGIARRGRALRRQGRFDAVVVGYLGQFDVLLARLLFPRERIVLDLLIFGADTAADRGAAGRLLLRALAALDRAAVACADLVVVDTEEHAALLPARARRKAVVVPVGAPADWFAAGPASTGARPAGGEERALRVVFFGLFTPLQGGAVIGEALGLLAGCGAVETTVIGHGQDLAACRRLAGDAGNVRWRDWVEPGALPALVAGHDVCLGIFGTTPKAMRVVPNKVFQGAAAGCALVTSDTGPQRRALGDAARYVPPGDAPALAEMLRRLAGDRAEVARLQTRARALAEGRFTAREVVSALRSRLAPAATAGRAG